MRSPCRAEKGFTLLEIIIVIALIAGMYSIAMPRFGIRSGAEISSKLGQLSIDIRSAYDMAVLTGKTYRLVFNLVSGDYMLQVADREQVFLGKDSGTGIGSGGIGRDPTEEEEREAQEEFTKRFEEYEVLAGESFRNPDDEDNDIKATSPVVEAKSILKPVVWTSVVNQEWQARSLGPPMIIRDIQAEHHGQRQTADEDGEKTRAMIYFFPSGYVEKAVLHIYMRKGDAEIDETEPPYTVITDPYAGMATIKAGLEEVDVHADTGMKSSS